MKRPPWRSSVLCGASGDGTLESLTGFPRSHSGDIYTVSPLKEIHTQVVVIRALVQWRNVSRWIVTFV